MILKPITVWRIFHGLKLYLSGQSSTFFLAKITPSAFQKHFERVECEHFVKAFKTSENFLHFCVSSFSYNRDLTITELSVCEDYYKEKYNEWCKRRMRPQYYFLKDIEKVFEELENKEIKYSDWLYGGMAVSWYMESRLYIDTFILLNRVTNFLTNHQGLLYNKLYKTFTDAYGNLVLKEDKYDLKTYKELYINHIKSIKSNKINQSTEN